MAIVCKHCKSEVGFYVREKVSGYAHIYYSEKGDLERDQHSMYDSLDHTGGRYAYCRTCHKSIGLSEKLKSGIVQDENTFTYNE